MTREPKLLQATKSLVVKVQMCPSDFWARFRKPPCLAIVLFAIIDSGCVRIYSNVVIIYSISGWGQRGDSSTLNVTSQNYNIAFSNRRKKF